MTTTPNIGQLLHLNKTLAASRSLGPMGQLAVQGQGILRSRPDAAAAVRAETIARLYYDLSPEDRLKAHPLDVEAAFDTCLLRNCGLWDFRVLAYNTQKVVCVRCHTRQ
jgi:hypothetical protein